eukprot:767375-Hanusia_phi.AAC.4
MRTQLCQQHSNWQEIHSISIFALPASPLPPPPLLPPLLLPPLLLPPPPLSPLPPFPPPPSLSPQTIFTAPSSSRLPCPPSSTPSAGVRKRHLLPSRRCKASSSISPVTRSSSPPSLLLLPPSTSLFSPLVRCFTEVFLSQENFADVHIVNSPPPPAPPPVIPHHIQTPNSQPPPPLPPSAPSSATEGYLKVYILSPSIQLSSSLLFTCSFVPLPPLPPRRRRLLPLPAPSSVSSSSPTPVFVLIDFLQPPNIHSARSEGLGWSPFEVHTTTTISSPPAPAPPTAHPLPHPYPPPPPPPPPAPSTSPSSWCPLHFSQPPLSSSSSSLSVHQCTCGKGFGTRAALDYHLQQSMESQRPPAVSSEDGPPSMRSSQSMKCVRRISQLAHS